MSKKEGRSLNETQSFLTSKEMNAGRDNDIPVAMRKAVKDVSMSGTSDTKLAYAVKKMMGVQVPHVLDATVHRGPRIQISRLLRKQATSALSALNFTLDSMTGLYNAQGFVTSLMQRLRDSSDGAGMETQLEPVFGAMRVLYDLSHLCSGQQTDGVFFKWKDCSPVTCDAFTRWQ